MDKKSNVNRQDAGNSSTDGSKSRETALEKLRQMEWKRNTHDTHHLARSSPQANSFRERKKYNKDEDNYFEGTGVQKTKKVRRPKVSEGPSSVPQGFSVADISTGPPPVSAWSKKKGSELFQKEDEIDEEELMMKLVLEESLKSHEEDKRRRSERLRMTNLDLQVSTHTKFAERDWEDGYRKDNVHSKADPDEYQEDSKQPELHFVETDDNEKPTVSQRRRSIPPRASKTSPQTKSSPPLANKSSNPCQVDKKVPLSKENTSAKKGYEVWSDPDSDEFENDEVYEHSHPQTKYSQPKTKIEEPTGSIPSRKHHSNVSMLHGTAEKHDDIQSDNLALNDSILTFGETKDIFEKITDNESQNHRTVTDIDAEKDISIQNEISETDLFLSRVLKFEPSSDVHSMVHSTVPQTSAVIQPNDSFNLPTTSAYSLQNMNSAQYYLTQFANMDRGFHVPNGRDSCSSISDSPLPYGSLDKEMVSDLRPVVQVPSQTGSVPHPYPYSFENQEQLRHNLEAMQYMNQNLSTLNKEYSSTPTPAPSVMPRMAQPQFCLPVSRFQHPSIQPTLFRQQMQQAYLQQLQMPPGYLPQMMMYDATRIQQSQSSISTDKSEADDNTLKEQASQAQILQAHALSLAQAQTLSQTRTQVPLNQPNEFQSIPSQTLTPKQELLQQPMLQGLMNQTDGQTKEELCIKYQNVLQMLKQVEEQMQKAHVEPPMPVAQPQPQPTWGVISPPAVMPMSVNQFFPMGISSHQVPTHLIQTGPNAGIISPTMQYNLPGSMNTSSEINPVEDSMQTSVGRGRGRLL